MPGQPDRIGHVRLCPNRVRVRDSPDNPDSVCIHCPECPAPTRGSVQCPKPRGQERLEPPDVRVEIMQERKRNDDGGMFARVDLKMFKADFLEKAKKYFQSRLFGDRLKISKANFLELA